MQINFYLPSDEAIILAKQRLRTLIIPFCDNSVICLNLIYEKKSLTQESNFVGYLGLKCSDWEVIKIYLTTDTVEGYKWFK